MLDDVQIILSGLWVAVMLCYLLGDVLSIFAGDFTPGEIGGKPLTQTMVLIMAILMVIPIIMVVLSLTFEYSLNRWANIIVAIFFFGMNLFTLRGYGIYEKFTLIVSMGFNVLTVWFAWNWV
ncbi:MAG: DUF6326 family protein [Candidatus Hodarchaeales archaeon]|jgi:hypothetical protein